MGGPPKHPSKRDFYADLGISPSASRDEIKQAFNHLAILHHPDKKAPGETIDAVRFRQAREAFDTLSDVELRPIYDKWFHPVWSSNRIAFADWQKAEDVNKQSAEPGQKKSARDWCNEKGNEQWSRKKWISWENAQHTLSRQGFSKNQRRRLNMAVFCQCVGCLHQRRRMGQEEIAALSTRGYSLEKWVEWEISQHMRYREGLTLAQRREQFAEDCECIGCWHAQERLGNEKKDRDEQLRRKNEKARRNTEEFARRAREEQRKKAEERLARQNAEEKRRQQDAADRRRAEEKMVKEKAEEQLAKIKAEQGEREAAARAVEQRARDGHFRRFAARLAKEKEEKEERQKAAAAPDTYSKKVSEHAYDEAQECAANLLLATSFMEKRRDTFLAEFQATGNFIHGYNPQTMMIAAQWVCRDGPAACGFCDSEILRFSFACPDGGAVACPKCLNEMRRIPSMEAEG